MGVAAAFDESKYPDAHQERSPPPDLRYFKKAQR
jgi:hypothetical protein